MPPKKKLEPAVNPLAGKSIVFTGTLEMKRADATKAAEACGASVKSAVSGATNILVAGPGAGKKVEDAEAKGVEVWTEAQFIAAINGAGGAAASSSSSAPAPAAASAKAETKSTASKKKVEPIVNPLAGKSIVFTGTLEMKRADATKAAEACGASVKSAVSGATNILVAGPGAGKKVEDALAKGVEVWTEAQFIAAMNGAGGAAASSSSSAPAPAAAGKAASKGGKKRANEDAEESTVDEAAAEKKPTKGAKVAAPAPAAAPAQLPPPTPSGPSGGSSSGGGGGKKGGPDSRVPDAGSFTVLEDYDVKLMYTDIGSSVQGNNKFYIIQVLQGKGKFWAWNRWGRLGEGGQNSMKECSTAAEAIKDFEKKFQDKTKNKWADVRDDRSAFIRRPDKYELVETDESEGGGDGAALGKLSVAQIEKGKAVLAEIKTILDGSSSAASGAFRTLSSKFYSLIPTESGRKAPEPINNHDILNAKDSLLDFWLRMGFEDMKEVEDTGVTPIDGVMEIPLPPNLQAACSAGKISDSYSIQQSRDRATQLKSANAGTPVKPMDKELYAAILLYTGNSIYAELNRVLRSEDRKAARKFHHYLRMFFEAMECMPKQKRTLWRGISVDLFDQYTEGKVITWWSVSSCTADQNVARGFMQSCGGACTLLTLDCQTAMDVSALSFYSNEKESLLAPGTQLKVISRKKVGLITEIHVQEVGRAV